MPTVVTFSPPSLAADSIEVSERSGEPWAWPMGDVDAAMSVAG